MKLKNLTVEEIRKPCKMLNRRNPHKQSEFSQQVFYSGFNNSKNRRLYGNLFQVSAQYSPQPRSEPGTPKLKQTMENKDSACSRAHLVESVQEYCQKTTLHGLRYVGDSGLHITERFFWTLAFIFGVLAAAYFISTLYTRWEESPMIITISPVSTHIEWIPFPAVTVCNMNVARKSIADEILRAGDSKDAMTEKLLLKDFCKYETGYETEDDISKRGNWSVIKKFMIKVTQPCHEMLILCKWRSLVVPCGDMFNAELTDEGICCSFNKVKRDFIYRNLKQSLDLNQTFPYPGFDWTPETGYPDNVTPDTVPWRAWGAGKSMGLSLTLDVETNEYFCSSTSSVGFKILLHNPIETPKIADYAYFITPGQEIRMSVEPVISSATRTLVNVAKNKRQCFFTSDRQLRFYRTYSQRNCEMECQSNYTMQQCHCVPYYLPKDEDSRICGRKDEECIDKARNVMEYKLKDDNIKLPEGWNQSRPADCACLPSCFRIQYNKQDSSTQLDSYSQVKPSNLIGRNSSYFTKNMAILHIFFNENEFTGLEKGEIFGFTEFLSNTGGLLGLFLGFSFMSAAEVVYFLSLKVICSWSRKHNKKVLDNNWNHQHKYPFFQN